MMQIVPRETTEFHTNYEAMYNNIQNELEKYIVNANLKALVLGVSGGIDSALAAALAYPVCKDLGIPLIGVSIPIQSNKVEEIKRARAIGKAYCTDFHEADLGFSFLQLSHTFATESSFMDSKETEFEIKVRKGNIKARMRMIYLYNLAQMHKGMVLSTDNYTEFLLGFWTLHGDVGDYGMFQNLWKTEVYGLANWIAEQDSIKGFTVQYNAMRDCILATPTDGLGITNSDLEQLGATTYAEVDRCLLNLFFPEKEVTATAVYKRIEARHKATGFKRNNPFNLSRDVIIRS